MEDLKIFLEEIDLYISIPISMELSFYSLGLGEWENMIIPGLPERKRYSMNRLIFSCYDMGKKRFGLIFHRSKKEKEDYIFPEHLNMMGISGCRPICFKKVVVPKLDFIKYPEKNVYVSSSGPMNIDFLLEDDLRVRDYLHHIYLDYERKLS